MNVTVIAAILGILAPILGMMFEIFRMIDGIKANIKTLEEMDYGKDEQRVLTNPYISRFNYRCDGAKSITARNIPGNIPGNIH